MENPRHSENILLPVRQSCQDPADNDFCDEVIRNAERRNIPMLPPPDHENREVNQKRNISNLSIDFRKLLIGIVGGSLLTVVVVAPAVFLSTNSNSPTGGKDNLISLKFDKSTLHQNIFMSEDGLKLSNFYSRDTPVSSVKNPNTLSEYVGVIGNKCIKRNSKIYFEVHYEFTAIDEYAPSKLIFEVGLAERNRVDSHPYVGTRRTGGWSYNIYNCHDANDTICLSGDHDGNDFINELYLEQRSQGSKHNGTINFIVNTSQDTFSFTRNSSNGTLTIYSFHNVFSTQRLCPVFGLYHSAKYQVKLSLLNTYDFSGATWNVGIF